MNERTPDVHARTFRWYAGFPSIRAFPLYRNRAYPMVMPMKSTRYTNSSGLFAHSGIDAPRVSFGGAVGTGLSAAAAFCLPAEDGASARLVVSAAGKAEGDDMDHAALSCGAEVSDPTFSSSSGLAGGATESVAPISRLSRAELSSGA